MMGEELGLPPQKGGPSIYTRRATPPTSLHLQPRSWIRVATAGRTPPPAGPQGSGDPPTQNSPGRENPHPIAPPTRFGSPSGPAHCPLPPTPTPSPEEALDRGPLIKRMPPPTVRGPASRPHPAPLGSYSQRGKGLLLGGSMPGPRGEDPPQ